MQEKHIDIETPEGMMNAFVAHPDAVGPFPAVVIYMDFWGFREELFDIVRRVAAAGYYCIMPNFYYRQGHRVSHAYYDDKGRMISFEALDEERKKAALAPLEKLSNAMVINDTGTLLNFMHSGEPVRRGAVGSIGYCMGGRHVFCVAGHYSEYFQAGASLHGTNLILDREDSPHHLASKFRGELYCGFAETDPYASPDVIRGLDEILKKCPHVTYRYEVHKGAYHGYALPDRDIFHKAGANRDWEIIFAMFYRQIPPYAGTIAKQP